MLELILGGARSGKSRMAEQKALASFDKRVYIATATAHDEEMAQRIAQHQQQRDSRWINIEAPIELAAALNEHAEAQTAVLVDCLTLWLTNLLMREDPALFERERQALLDTLADAPGHILLVSNSVGMGVVPMGKLTRDFVDQSGLLEQAIASISDTVTLVVAGLPLILKAPNEGIKKG